MSDLKSAVLERLQCPICTEHFDNDARRPLMLPCFHTICSADVEHLHELHGDALFCPFDRRPIPLSDRGVGGLPLNYIVDDLIRLELLRNNAQESCSLCRAGNVRPASHRCGDCSRFLCAAHSAVHSDDYAHRQVMTLQEYTQSDIVVGTAVAMCAEHQNEDLEFYCLTHNTPVCAKCLIVKHQRCDRDDIKSTFAREKASISALLPPARAKADILRAAAASISANADRVVQASSTARRDITSYFDSAIARLTEHKHSMLARVNEIENGKRSILTMQAEEVNSTMSMITSSCNEVARLLGYDNDVRALALKVQMVSNLRYISDMEIRQLPTIPDDIRFVADQNLPRHLQALTFAVDDFSPVASQCVAELAAYTDRFIVGEQCRIRLTAKDHRGALSTRAHPDGAFSVEMKGPDSNASVQVSKDGGDDSAVYTASFRVSQQGRYTLGITVGGEPIPGSPFAIGVEEKEMLTAVVDAFRSPGMSVRVSASSCANGSPQNIVQGGGANFFTANTPSQWIQFSLSRPVQPTYYKWRCWRDGHGNKPRNWVFQGSKDGAQWVTLDQAVDRQTFGPDGDYTNELHTFRVLSPSARDFFTHLRVLSTGPTSSTQHYLVMNYFDVDGLLR